jgi:hypothetical protein
MRINYGIGALALAAAIVVMPFAAKAELTTEDTAKIKAAVDTAMKTGETGKLAELLTKITTANPDDAGAITDIVAQQISTDAAANPGATLENSTTTIAEAVTTTSVISIVAAAPGQAGTVLAEAQTNLSPDLIVAAVTATQTALAPAAGGPPNGNNGNGNGNGNNNNANNGPPTSATAEIPRRITASPSA